MSHLLTVTPSPLEACPHESPVNGDPPCLLLLLAAYKDPALDPVATLSVVFLKAPVLGFEPDWRALGFSCELAETCSSSRCSFSSTTELVSDTTLLESSVLSEMMLLARPPLFFCGCRLRLTSRRRCLRLPKRGCAITDDTCSSNSMNMHSRHEKSTTLHSSMTQFVQQHVTASPCQPPMMRCETTNGVLPAD